MAKKLAGGVKEILGTCNSIGCTVNGESPRDIQAGIDDGEVEIPDAIFIAPCVLVLFCCLASFTSLCTEQPGAALKIWKDTFFCLPENFTFGSRRLSTDNLNKQQRCSGTR